MVIPCSLAATISGLSSRIAVERTMASTPFTYSLLCPICTVAPISLNLEITADSAISEPDTS